MKKEKKKSLPHPRSFSRHTAHVEPPGVQACGEWRRGVNRSPAGKYLVAPLPRLTRRDVIREAHKTVPNLRPPKEEGDKKIPTSPLLVLLTQNGGCPNAVYS